MRPPEETRLKLSSEQKLVEGCGEKNRRGVTKRFCVFCILPTSTQQPAQSCTVQYSSTLDSKMAALSADSPVGSLQFGGSEWEEEEEEEPMHNGVLGCITFQHMKRDSAQRIWRDFDSKTSTIKVLQ
ncbi:hypothetical protein CRUP_019307 [Coryphaenoides rupestris]|nr:hypothetical protein CRUP_019307 [Coryphaenoides rupestris]